MSYFNKVVCPISSDTFLSALNYMFFKGWVGPWQVVLSQKTVIS